MIMGLNYPVCTQYACDRLRGDWEKWMPIKFPQQLKTPSGAYPQQRPIADLGPGVAIALPVTLTRSLR